MIRKSLCITIFIGLVLSLFAGVSFAEINSKLSFDKKKQTLFGYRSSLAFSSSPFILYGLEAQLLLSQKIGLELYGNIFSVDLVDIFPSYPGMEGKKLEDSGIKGVFLQPSIVFNIWDNGINRFSITTGSTFSNIEKKYLLISCIFDTIEKDTYSRFRIGLTPLYIGFCRGSYLF